MDKTDLLKQINDIDDDLIAEAAEAQAADAEAAVEAAGAKVAEVQAANAESTGAAEAESAGAQKEPALSTVPRRRNPRLIISILAACLVLGVGITVYYVLNPPTGRSSREDLAIPGPAVSETGPFSASFGITYETSAYVAHSEVDLLDLSYEEILQQCDLLLVGTCTKVSPSWPKKGYTGYTFSVDRIVGGQYEAAEITLARPTDTSDNRLRLLWQTDSSTTLHAFTTGHQYLIPVIRDDLKDGTYYAFASHQIVIDLTTGDTRILMRKSPIPAGKSIEEYSAEIFNAAH